MRKLHTVGRVLEEHGARGLGTVAREKLDALRQRLWERPVERVREVVQLRIRPRLLARRVRHLHGPAAPAYDVDELLVACVVRNSESYVRPFVEHYRALGARHLVFLDNGSTDRTVELLRAYDGVTVLQTDAPYDRYENSMKRYLAERFSTGRWHLLADIDEHFDYPFSDRLGLREFLAYLNSRDYTAVVTQMLDLFADRPLDGGENEADEDLAHVYRYYDLSHVVTSGHRYLAAPDPRIQFHRGGIRAAAFGTRNGLTKASLVRMDGRVEPFVEWHSVRGARFADVSCVLRHYPFRPSFYEKVRDAVRTGRYGRVTSDEYAAYWAVLAERPGLNLRGPTARELTSLDELVADGFLVVSEAYRRWAAERGAPVGAAAGAGGYGAAADGGTSS